MGDVQSRFVGLPERRAVLKNFSRAVTTFDRSDFIHEQARNRMLDRTRFFTLEPCRILDMGSATGKGTVALAALYPKAQIVSIDLIEVMASATQSRCRSLRHTTVLVGDAEQLPLSDNSVDLIFANMILPWCDPQLFFKESARVLSDGGLMLFSTVGPDTLKEIRQAWAEVDKDVHVQGFIDMHDLGDLVVKAGLIEPVMDVDRFKISYKSKEQLFQDLRQSGGTNSAFGRKLQLTGYNRWKKFCNQLEISNSEEQLSISSELIFGLAWGGGSASKIPKTDFSIPIEEITRELPRR